MLCPISIPSNLQLMRENTMWEVASRLDNTTSNMPSHDCNTLQSSYLMHACNNKLDLQNSS